MKYCVPTGNWREAINKDGVVIASHLMSKKDDGMTIKNVITTAFKANLWEEMAVCPQLATGTSTVTTTTTTTTTTQSSFTFAHDPITCPIIEQTTPIITQTVQAKANTSYQVHVQQTLAIPQYTKEELMDRTVAELQGMHLFTYLLTIYLNLFYSIVYKLFIFF